MDIYVARQPVFTADRKIFGYELLFRAGLENAFPDIDGDVATSKVLSNTFFSFDLKQILGDKPGLVNFTRKLLLQKAPLIFPQSHIIVEILEDIEPEKKVLDAMAAIRDKGFNLALDDFIFHKRFEPMMAMASIIKFDLIATPLDSLEQIVSDIKEKYEITLLAEKVETYEEFNQAKAMGFTLFQGYFFSKPEILSNREISTPQISKLKLMNEINQTEMDLNSVETLIKNDVSISFKLLKFINSAYFQRPVPVNTIKDAMTFLGSEELRKFINIIAVAGLDENKPNELIRSSVIRARMCELCGTVMKTGFTTDELFTMGLFSHMDAILDLPMEEILNTISLSDTIKAALSGENRNFKKILDIVASFEQGDWQNNFYSVMKGLPIERRLPEFYLDAIKMVNSFFE